MALAEKDLKNSPFSPLEGTGIYRIYNNQNGKSYIGQSVNLAKRIRRHQNELQKGIHPNKELQEDFNKYGATVFDISVLTHCHKGLLDREEAKLIKKYNSIEAGYNRYNAPKDKHPVVVAVNPQTKETPDTSSTPLPEEQTDVKDVSHPQHTTTQQAEEEEEFITRWEGYSMIASDLLNSGKEFSKSLWSGLWDGNIFPLTQNIAIYVNGERLESYDKSRIAGRVAALIIVAAGNSVKSAFSKPKAVAAFMSLATLALFWEPAAEAFSYVVWMPLAAIPVGAWQAKRYNGLKKILVGKMNKKAFGEGDNYKTIDDD